VTMVKSLATFAVCLELRPLAAALPTLQAHRHAMVPTCWEQDIVIKNEDFASGAGHLGLVGSGQFAHPKWWQGFMLHAEVMQTDACFVQTMLVTATIQLLVTTSSWMGVPTMPRWHRDQVRSHFHTYGGHAKSCHCHTDNAGKYDHSVTSHLL